MNNKSRLDIINYLARMGQATVSFVIIGAAFFGGTYAYMLRRGLYTDMTHLFKTTVIIVLSVIFLFFLFALQMSRLKLEVKAAGLTVHIARKKIDIPWDAVDYISEYTRERGKKKRTFICIKIKADADVLYNEIHIDKSDKLMSGLDAYYTGKIEKE